MINDADNLNVTLIHVNRYIFRTIYRESPLDISSKRIRPRDKLQALW